MESAGWESMPHTCIKQNARQQMQFGNLQTSNIHQPALFDILLCFIAASLLITYLEMAFVFINVTGFFSNCFFPSLNLTNAFLLITVVAQRAKEHPKLIKARKQKTEDLNKSLDICKNMMIMLKQPYSCCKY